MNDVHYKITYITADGLKCEDIAILPPPRLIHRPTGAGSTRTYRRIAEEVGTPVRTGAKTINLLYVEEEQFDLRSTRHLRTEYMGNIALSLRSQPRSQTDEQPEQETPTPSPYCCGA